MKSIAVIGGGISGLSIAQRLKNEYKIKVFESASKPGGLIKCERIDGNLYHMVGGHVFNSRRKDVLDWFWSFFNREEEFTKSVRNATVFMDKPIGYPIENHVYQMGSDIIKQVIADLLKISKGNVSEPENFEEFLRGRFGDTLYELYFKPYNEKVWRRDLTKVPLNWLAGKLPMPTVEEIFYNNFNREKEMNMVHSTFYYAKKNGSQFLADRLAKGLDISFNSPITTLKKNRNGWIVNNAHECDEIIFAGNIKQLPDLLKGEDLIDKFSNEIDELESHGTTTVLCEIDKNPYSWIYLPDKNHHAHRIICTGNFSKTNNAPDKMSATIEFTDFIEKKDILENLNKIPFSPKYIDHRFTKYTYPIQNMSTNHMIGKVKNELAPHGIYLLGRFAEWEYYNMDAAIGAALDLSKNLLAKNKEYGESNI